MINPVTLFKALGDDTRIRILNLLSLQEFNVNELVNILDMGQSRISRHLKILSDCGLVTYRRDGLWVFYSTPAAGLKAGFIASIRDVLAAELHRISDAEQAQKLLSENRKAVIHFFDEIAPNWDAMQKEVFDGFDPGTYIIEQVPRCGIAADLGCGTGSIFPNLMEKAGHIIGVDSSGNMLDTARKKFSGSRDRIDFRLGEMAHLPLKDREADCAVINMVLHHLSSIEGSLGEAFRILKEDGVLIILDFKKHRDESFRSRFQDRRLGFDPEELGKTIIKTGFTITGKIVREITPDLHTVLITARK